MPPMSFAKLFPVGLLLWILAMAAIWTHCGGGYEMLFYGAWAALFIWMVIEDFLQQTVDVRLAAALFALTAIYRCMVGEGVELACGCIAGVYISTLIFILGVRIETEEGEEKGEEKTLQLTAMKIGFVPSMGIAIALGFFAGDFMAGLEELLLGVGESIAYQGAESIAIFSLFMGLVGFAQNVRIRRRKAENPKVRTAVGFGEGDILVCLIVGGLIGWKGFLVIFFGALCVHVAMTVILFVISNFIERNKT